LVGNLGVALALVLSVLGCASSAPGEGLDAGPDGATDAIPTLCFGARVCVGDEVHACENGTLGATVDVCQMGMTCSLGRCATPVCTAAESDRTGFVGCLFYVFEADNVTSDEPLPTSLLVTNPSTTDAATVTLQLPALDASGPTWVFDAQVSVAPGGAARLQVLGQEVVPVALTPQGALRLTSDHPVTVAVVHSDDRDQATTNSSAGTMVLPAQTIGAHYRVMTYKQIATDAVAATPGARGGAGRIAIVGTQANTHVTVTLSATATATDPPAPFDGITIGDGDVFQIYSAADGSDLTGTEILADAPVAVFSGNMTTTYGATQPGVNSPDMAHEQMPPIGAWSRRWVAAALPPQANTCNTLFGTPGSSIWRVLASVDDTSVTFDGPPGVSGLPGFAVPLQTGEVWEMVTSGGSFTVTASRPVLVTQGIDCEPSLALAVSLDHLLDDLTFAVLPNFDQLVSVVRPQGTGTPIMFDGAPVDDAAFQPAGAGFEVAQIPIPACGVSQEVCTHELAGHFGMTLRGMDVLSSYALTAPTFAGCVDLSDPTCVN
jgi:hypothetical protein